MPEKAIVDLHNAGKTWLAEVTVDRNLCGCFSTGGDILLPPGQNVQSNICSEVQIEPSAVFRIYVSCKRQFRTWPDEKAVFDLYDAFVECDV